MLLHVVAFALWDVGVGTSPVSVRLLGNGHLVVEHDHSNRQKKRDWTNASVSSVGTTGIAPRGTQWQRAPTITGSNEAWHSLPLAEVSTANGSVGWVHLEPATSEASGLQAAVSSSAESPALSGPRSRAIHHAAFGNDLDWAELHEVQMALLESHANTLASNAGLDAKGPEDDPNLPDQNVKEKPESWTGKAWTTYQTVYKTLAPLRGGVGNVAATFAAMGLGPENCVLKLAYILYTEDDEDDYPYLPRGCGDGFNFLINTAGPHNWLGISGTLLLVLLFEAGLAAPMNS